MDLDTERFLSQNPGLIALSRFPGATWHEGKKGKLDGYFGVEYLGFAFLPFGKIKIYQFPVDLGHSSVVVEISDENLLAWVRKNLYAKQRTVEL